MKGALDYAYISSLMGDRWFLKIELPFQNINKHKNSHAMDGVPPKFMSNTTKNHHQPHTQL